MYKYRRPKMKYILGLLLLALALGGDSAPSAQRFSLRLNQSAVPFTFDLVRWEVQALREKIGARLGSWRQERLAGPADPSLGEYFASAQEVLDLQYAINQAASQGDKPQAGSLEAQLRELRVRRGRLRPLVEATVEKDIEAVLAEEGFTSSIGGMLNFIFPPVVNKLDRLPLVLVVSPRERIAIKAEVYLLPDLTSEQIEAIERATERLGVSALVVPIGGFSTYPSMVSETAPLEYVAHAAAHEWFHQYLFFKPLGWRYWDSHELVTMNETVASIAGDEIGRQVSARYRKPEPPGSETKDEPGPPDQRQEFDFNREMRRIRLQVDRLLARGDVAGAERFMEDSRQYLLTKGVYLRKLNQAYFAFYGSYADSPISVDPIGQDLRELRRRSSTLKEFVKSVARMTSYRQLRVALGKE
jgi:hypothetical protein